ncbi:RNA polymerase sigma factor [Streptomyces purpureus]|uniref:Sigma-70 family RNA polymerase sigma factor n=1 Tax=Streptomyces purpureus TaxID=1951 RepID=A0A918LP43_9ACTN|nr:sigma factor [Streptomyces purpureus]GGT30435.1 hypothetical protein GCM10014713_25060 [Streptomyces purpureus]
MVDSGTPDEAPGHTQEVSRLFQEHYQEYVRKVTARLRHRFPGLRDWSEDIANEALLRTLDTWLRRRNRAGSSPLPYMHRVAHHLAVDATARTKEQPVDDTSLLRLADRGDGCRHEAVTPVDPLEEVARPAVAEMKATQRKQVADRQLRGMEESEIAQDLKMPRQQVRVLSSKAARELRAMEQVRLHTRDRHLTQRRRVEEGTGE